MDPAARKALLLESAKVVFSETGYTQTGLAEIAKAADVSKTLLYHYYPEGRPELYLAVMDSLVSDLLGRVRVAARTPASNERRLHAVTEALFAFFDDEPEAFRLLFREPWGSGEAAILGQAMAIRVRIATELSTLLSSSGASVTTFMGAAAATVGALISICELWISGQIERDDAVQAASAYVHGGLAELGVL
jgi:AcrR family transcriptional regulator